MLYIKLLKKSFKNIHGQGQMKMIRRRERKRKEAELTFCRPTSAKDLVVIWWQLTFVECQIWTYSSKTAIIISAVVVF